jgi:hypothetical protein
VWRGEGGGGKGVGGRGEGGRGVGGVEWSGCVVCVCGVWYVVVGMWVYGQVKWTASGCMCLCMCVHMCRCA